MGTTMPPLEVGKRGKKRAAELRVRPDAGKCGKGHTQQTTDSVGPVSTLESVKSCAPKVDENVSTLESVASCAPKVDENVSTLESVESAPMKKMA